jgi:hypothetical protein
MPMEQDIVSAEYALSSIRDDLERRGAEATKRAAEQVCLAGSPNSRVMEGPGNKPTVHGSPTSSPASVEMRVRPVVLRAIRLQLRVSDPSADLQEHKGLEALEYQTARSLDDLHTRRAAAKFSGTFHDRLNYLNSPRGYISLPFLPLPRLH